MNPAEPLQLTAATVGMVAALLFAFIPVLPGPVLLWGVALIFGVSEGFHRVTPLALIIITLLMIIGTSSDIWLSLFGVKTGCVTCLGTLGSFIGGIVGTLLIPIPLLGTMVGFVVGALLFELIRYWNIRKALQAGQGAVKIFIMGYLIGLAASILIFAVYLVSVLTTG
jgi:uncharacterized protein